MVQEGDRRCKKSTLNDLAYLTPLRIPLMNPVCERQSRDTYAGYAGQLVDLHELRALVLGRARICKPFKEPRNRFLAWQAGT